MRIRHTDEVAYATAVDSLAAFVADALARDPGGARALRRREVDRLISAALEAEVERSFAREAVEALLGTIPPRLVIHEWDGRQWKEIEL